MRITHTLAIGAVALAALVAPASASADPLEDEPGWSCVDDGNRICGPGNDEGKPAACYDDGGVIVALWPCEAWSPNAYDAGSYVGGFN